MTAKYSDVLADWLVELGYTTCFFLGGGNIMHILESCSRKLRCIPVVHEVAGGIAAEYFNGIAENERAFAMVTAGPGITNIVTAVAGAWLEKRELLVIAGQVKTADLSKGDVRQRGIQEINGVDIMRSITVRAERMDDVMDKTAFMDLAETGSRGPNGPVFLELPLDVQARQVDVEALSKKPAPNKSALPQVSQSDMEKLAKRLFDAERPVFLVGGGVSYGTAMRAAPFWQKMGVPVVTTYNGWDRIAFDNPSSFGRSNTWGMRYSNLVLQQADLVVALGTRLGLQQTGFNWQQFAPVGKVVQIDCDKTELKKGHPKVDWPIHGDVNPVLDYLTQADLGSHTQWVDYCNEIKAALPLIEDSNKTAEGYISPYIFNTKLSALCTPNDTVISCSSGGAFTVTLQSFQNKLGQKMLSNKGLASMGYGLSGAIGAAIAGKTRRTILIEGDGGFSQNIQEIGTVAVNKLNLKMFIFDDNGYASIRMTQSTYFGGRYVGCDTNTGLGMPDWEKLFAVWNVPVMRLKPGFENDAEFKNRFEAIGPAAFIVPIDPKQTYFPKITSRVTENGSMASNPLHRMSPDLDEALYKKVARYLV